MFFPSSNYDYVGSVVIGENSHGRLTIRKAHDKNKNCYFFEVQLGGRKLGSRVKNKGEVKKNATKLFNGDIPDNVYYQDFLDSIEYLSHNHDVTTIESIEGAYRGL